MPIKGIIFLAVILIFVAYCFRDEIYSWLIASSKNKNDDDENTSD